MDFKNLRITYILITAAVVAALLFGGRFAYQRVRLDNPFQQALSAVPGVAKGEIQKTPDGYELTLTMGRVNDLQTTVQEVERVAEQYGKVPVLKIQLKDNATPELKETYYQMHFAIEEAAAQGNFTAMKAQVDAQAARAGLTGWRVQVTDNQLYVQLKKGDSSLYRMVDRIDRTGGSETASAVAKGGLW